MPLLTECGRCARRRRQRNAEDDRTNSESYSTTPRKSSKSKSTKSPTNEASRAQSTSRGNTKEDKDVSQSETRARKEKATNKKADTETEEANSKQNTAREKQNCNIKDKKDERAPIMGQRSSRESFDSILAHVSESEDERHITIIRVPRRRRSMERSGMDTKTEHEPTTTRHIRTVYRRSPSPRRDRHRYEKDRGSEPHYQHDARQHRSHNHPSDYTMSDSTLTHRMRDAGWYDRIQHVPAGQIRGNRIQHHQRPEPEFTPSNSTQGSPPPKSPREGQRSTSGYVRLPPAQQYTYGQYADYHNQPPSHAPSNAPYQPSNVRSHAPHTPYPTYEDEVDRRGRSRYVHFPEDSDDEPMMSGGRSPAHSPARSPDRGDRRYDRPYDRRH
jgi:hypothetical protein